MSKDPKETREKVISRAIITEKKLREAAWRTSRPTLMLEGARAISALIGILRGEEEHHEDA